MDVSFLIRTYNEAKYINQLLDSINNQVGDFEYEIIIIDSGSNDNTVNFAKKHKNVKLIEIPKNTFTYGSSLNRGLVEATGTYVVILSGHCIIDGSNYLNNIINAFEADVSVGIIYGKHKFTQATRTSECIDFTLRFSRELKTSYPNNANAAYRRSLFNFIKFDPFLPALEDKDIAIKAMELGYRYSYLQGIDVYHLHEENNSQVFRRTYREKVANCVIDKKNDTRLLYDIFYVLYKVIKDIKFAILNRSIYKSIKGIIGYRVAEILGIYYASLYFMPRKKTPVINFLARKICKTNKLNVEL